MGFCNAVWTNRTRGKWEIHSGKAELLVGMGNSHRNVRNFVLTFHTKRRSHSFLQKSVHFWGWGGERSTLGFGAYLSGIMCVSAILRFATSLNPICFILSCISAVSRRAGARLCFCDGMLLVAACCPVERYLFINYVLYRSSHYICSLCVWYCVTCKRYRFSH